MANICKGIINNGLPFVVQNKPINDKLRILIDEAYETANSKKIKGFHNVDSLFKDMGYDK